MCKRVRFTDTYNFLEVMQRVGSYLYNRISCVVLNNLI